MIRIDDVGRASAVNYASLTYSPQAPELKYFLIRSVHEALQAGCARPCGSNTRSRCIPRRGRLADATIEANRKDGTIERFLTSGSEEIDVRVKNVTLKDLRQPPYRATVEFDQVFSTTGDAHGNRCSRDLVAHLVFVMDDQVDNARIPDQSPGPDHYVLSRRPGFHHADQLKPVTRLRSARLMPFIPRQVKPPARIAVTCKLPQHAFRHLTEVLRRIPRQQPGVRGHRDAAARLPEGPRISRRG